MDTAFVEAALEDRGRAEELLAAHPGIAAAGPYPALVLGDAARVEQWIQSTPDSVKTKGGPRGWEPLLYVCFSRCAGDKVETARVLLRHGADPNAFYDYEDKPGNPLPCLYGATGYNNNPALGRVLLEAGANDGESLYHSTEHDDLECVRLLLDHGASPDNVNVLAHVLDRENMACLRLLLAAGGNPNQANDRGETALHWAVWRGRSVEVVTALLDAGADIDARRSDGRTAYAMAVQSGQTGIAALLASRGANTELSELDRFLGACAAASPDELSRLLAERPDLARSPESERLLPDLTTSHRTASVRALLAAGQSVHARGEAGATALHWACWKGYADLVEVLLEHGASLTMEDEQFHGTPSGWREHGEENCPERGGDWTAVARLLERYQGK